MIFCSTFATIIALCRSSQSDTQTVVEDNQSEDYQQIVNHEQLSWDILVLLKGQMRSMILQKQIQRTLEDIELEDPSQLSDADRQILKDMQMEQHMDRLIASNSSRQRLVAQSKMPKAAVPRRFESMLEVMSALLYSIVLSLVFPVLFPCSWFELYANATVDPVPSKSFGFRLLQISPRSTGIKLNAYGYLPKVRWQPPILESLVLASHWNYSTELADV